MRNQLILWATGSMRTMGAMWFNLLGRASARPVCGALALGLMLALAALPATLRAEDDDDEPVTAVAGSEANPWFRTWPLGKTTVRTAGVVSVDDPDTKSGKALMAARALDGYMASRYTWETMGVYESVFRIKVADNTSTEPVVMIGHNCQTQRWANVPPDVVSRLELKGTDFKAPNVYQEFSVTFLTPFQGRNAFMVQPKGVTTVWVDTLRTRLVRRLSEADLLAVLPDVTPPPAPTPRAGPWRVHLMRGFFSDFYQLDEAAARVGGARVTDSSFATDGSAAGQPTTPAALYSQDLVVFAGTSISPISIPMRVAYEKWVAAGGSLLVIGGPQSFSEARLSTSILGDLLPVVLKPSFDLKRETLDLTPGPGAASVPELLAGVDLTQPTPLTAMFRHDLRAREGATVVLGTAEAPLLVIGTHGKGRVACWLAPAMGDETTLPAGRTAFWNDSRTATLLGNTMRWLMTRPALPAPYAWTPSPEASPAAAKILGKLQAGGLDDVDIGALMGTDDKKTLTGEAGTFALAPADLQVLANSGGRAAVPHLLKAMPDIGDKEEIRRIEWAVRPFVTPADYPALEKLADDLNAPVRESAVALLGKADPERAEKKLRELATTSDSPRMIRAICRSAWEGNIRGMIPWLKKQQPKLKAQVAFLQSGGPAGYDGYWYLGVPPEDPLWAYAESTFALIHMGEPGYLGDATQMLLLLHLQEIKMRSFIFAYNMKVPREADAAERHSIRNQYARPDLLQLLGRVDAELATLPPALYPEFREAVMQVADYEGLRRLHNPVWYLIQTHPDDAAWQSWRADYDARTIALARAATRL